MLPDRTPAIYFPIERGLYEVGPGLRPFGHDFGNGDADQQAFQLDREFARYRSEKEAARSENLGKYFGVDRLSPAVQSEVVDFILQTIHREHPQYFQLLETRGTRRLECRITQETLIFSRSGDLVDVEGRTSPLPYQHALDALMSQLQEDAAIVSVDGDQNWLSAIHVCGPSHWDPRQKLGQDFTVVHQPVPGFEKVARAQRAIVDAMINKGPFVRFVWSFVTDTRLNHHPEPPPGADPDLWKGRSFQEREDGSAPFYLRVERQLMFGFPSVQSSLFLIRLSFIDGNVLRKNSAWRGHLVSALKSMTPESRIYKGVDQCFDRLVSWLESNPKLV